MCFLFGEFELSLLAYSLERWAESPTELGIPLEKPTDLFKVAIGVKLE